MTDGEMRPFRLRLPATSANLGPGFDTAAIAFDFHLEVEAVEAAEFSIEATGRNADRCGQLEDNLILGIYRAILEREGRVVQPLAIRMHNQIPLGMGCGSSAAGRLAAVALAVHFGQLGWSEDAILAEACRLEGHPDNAAACWLGGFVAAATVDGKVYVARVEPPAEWRAIVVVQREELATTKARKVLPESYSKADVIANLQSVALLSQAFAQARPDLLAVAMRDRIHQPYRAEICPLLPRLLPLTGEQGIIGVALSGAGPSVLVVVENEPELGVAEVAIRRALMDLNGIELIVSQYGTSGAVRY